MYFVRVVAIKVTFQNDLIDTDMPSLLPLASSLNFDLSAVPGRPLALTSLFQEGETVPGTTEEILLIGIVIVLIVVVPIIWARRRWMK